jgi:hypothetical protein
MYNNTYAGHFYQYGATQWAVAFNGNTDGCVVLRQSYNGNAKAYFYYDGSGSGLLTNTGNWGVRMNYNGGASPGGTLYGEWATTGYLVVADGGGYPYSTTSTGLYFGSNAQTDYRIYTQVENVSGNYTKLTIDWHTGIRIGAYTNYGGIRFYNNAVAGGGAKIFSVGEGDDNVRVRDYIYAQRFYDTNTAYYVDPNSYSNMQSINLDGNAMLSFNGETGAWGLRGRTTDGTANLGAALKNIIYCGGGSTEGLAIYAPGYGYPAEFRNDGYTSLCNSRYVRRFNVNARESSWQNDSDDVFFFNFSSTTGYYGQNKNVIFRGLHDAGGSGQDLTSFSISAQTIYLNGYVAKASGSFRIDHPLPALSETHDLVHSFIEGPQVDLIYRGVVSLVNGVASVNIDINSSMTEGTFEVLCREVQCFTTNETDWTPVRGKVTGNILNIEAQDPTSTASISWMVIGERKDKHIIESPMTDENGKVVVEPLRRVKYTGNLNGN